MIEMDHWILMVNATDHEMQVAPAGRVMVDSGAAVPSFLLGCVPVIPVVSFHRTPL